MDGNRQKSRVWHREYFLQGSEEGSEYWFALLAYTNIDGLGPTTGSIPTATEGISDRLNTRVAARWSVPVIFYYVEV